MLADSPHRDMLVSSGFPGKTDEAVVDGDIATQGEKMAATDSIIYSLERNWEMVGSAISDLDDETLAVQPNPHSNSIAWIFGHISRVTDMFIMHGLQSKPELWLTEGW